MRRCVFIRHRRTISARGVGYVITDVDDMITVYSDRIVVHSDYDDDIDR